MEDWEPHKNSEGSSSSSSEKQKWALKLKYHNRVKKLPNLPGKFMKLTSVVKKKYDEFKEGKSTYTIRYLDEDNEFIDISDEEDYSTFKEYVQEQGTTNAKLFLIRKGEEEKFNPNIDDGQTVCESMLYDENLESIATSRLPNMSSHFIPPGYVDRSQLDELKEQMKQLQKQLEEQKQVKPKKIKPISKSKEKKITEKTKEKQAQKDAKKARREAKEKKKAEKKIEKQEQKKAKAEKAKAKEEVKPAPVVVEEKEVKLNFDDEANEIVPEPKPVDQVVEEATNPLNKQNEAIELIKKDIQAAAPVIIEEGNIEAAKPSETEKHEFAIQPVFKRVDDEKVKEDVKIEDTQKWKDCNMDLRNEVRFICSICANDVLLCEACEIKSSHEHVFIKIPANVEFDPAAYDAFWQKILGIYAAPVEDHIANQEAIMNPNKIEEKIKFPPMMSKKAQILKKDKYKEGVPANKGELVHLEWEVKNLTSKAWSNNVTIECSNASDILIDSQKVNLQLKGAQKGTIEVDFKMPLDTEGRDELDLYLYLFDKEENKPIGEELKVKLCIYK